MKAVRLHKEGGPEQLVYEDAPKPTLNTDAISKREKNARSNSLGDVVFTRRKESLDVEHDYADRFLSHA